MAWNFRYYEKKRGHRRTGSRTVGSLGEAIFFAVLFVLGCAGMVAGVVLLVIPEWRVNHGFVENSCVVVQKRIGEIAGQNGPLYRPEITIRYRVQGIRHSRPTYDIYVARSLDREGVQKALDPFAGYSSDRESVEAAIDRFVEGQEYPCWYDPADPELIVLVRGYQWWIWLVFLVPGSFLMIGAGGLLYAFLQWGKSAERRAALAQRAQSHELFDPFGTGERPFPTVPDSSDITSSPGTKLAYRLPLAGSPAWVLFRLLTACLLWNGAVSFFAVSAIRGHLQNRPDWLLTLFTLPFLAIGVVLAIIFVRQLLIVTGVGPTLAEISAHPLVPGGQYRMFLTQSGRMKMNSLEVCLVCEEGATFRQGTNTRTETREVYRHPLLRQEEFEIRYGEPLETEFAMDVPARAMHSFRANHNEIQWKVVVRGDVVDRPDFERSFPVVVQPSDGVPSSEGSES